MSRLEFLEPTSKDYFDVLVEAGYTTPLHSHDLLGVLHQITTILQTKVAGLLFDALSYVEITENTLSLQFRFYHGKDWEAIFHGKEDSSTLRMQFIFFLFASIDTQYALSDVPFPSDFRVFLTLPQYLQEEGYV